jgi:hypothetical protein
VMTVYADNFKYEKRNPPGMVKRCNRGYSGRIF